MKRGGSITRLVDNKTYQPEIGDGVCGKSEKMVVHRARNAYVLIIYSLSL